MNKMDGNMNEERPHPLQKFTCCPVCGSSHFKIQDGKSKRCENCGFEFFLNPSTATAAFILNTQREILIERRRREPAKGTLDLPGGFVDIGETAEEGIIREVKEETDLDIFSPRYLFSLPNIYLYSGFNVPTLDLFFECKIKEWRAFQAKDDAAEVIWVPLRNLLPEQFGLSSIRKGIVLFLKSER